jgi:hypothetical protein
VKFRHLRHRGKRSRAKSRRPHVHKTIAGSRSRAKSRRPPGPRNGPRRGPTRSLRRGPTRSQRRGPRRSLARGPHRSMTTGRSLGRRDPPSLIVRCRLLASRAT